MTPLAEEIEGVLSEGSDVKYYSIAEKFDRGITGRLQLTIKDGKIIWCHYDEIFADDPANISPRAFKKYYGESKYASVVYDEPSRIGFNVQIDALNEKVIKTQNLFDLEGLPATGASVGVYAQNQTMDHSAHQNIGNTTHQETTHSAHSRRGGMMMDQVNNLTPE